jgi:hypothetical protein
LHNAILSGSFFLIVNREMPSRGGYADGHEREESTIRATRTLIQNSRTPLGPPKTSPRPARAAPKTAQNRQIPP